jgi:uncharacterized protein (UPF0254 family)
MPKSIEETIIKECFWEYHFTHRDIRALATSTDAQEQMFLFGKILANATHLLRSMAIFDLSTLEKLILTYKVPAFNHDFTMRRIHMLEYYFLDKPLTINELKWIA